MPIPVNDYEWKESDSTVFVTVPLKGTSAKKADLFCSDVYIKVHAPPHLFEADLLHEIDEENSVATVADGCVRFRLEKVEPGLWGELKLQGEGKELRARREESIIRLHARNAEKEKQKREAKAKADKFAVQQAMDADRAKREELESLKKQERDAAEKEVSDWQSSLATEEKKSSVDKMAGGVQDGTSIFGDENQEGGKAIAAKAAKAVPAGGVAGVRSSGTISVSFTPRVLPVPAREHKDQEFLDQVTKKKNTASGDASMDETSAIWLKDKGQIFYKSGDYKSALNAFTEAIKLDDTMPSLFSSRAACHLQLGQLSESIADCDTALAFLPEIIAEYTVPRLKVLVRRGAALCRAGRLKESEADYAAALKIAPDNVGVQADLAKIREAISGGAK